MDRLKGESWGGTTGTISQNFFWIYDAAGRLTIAHEGPPTGSTTFYSYAYDNLDRNTVQSHFIFGSNYSAVSTQAWDVHSRRDAITYAVTGPGGINANLDFTNDYAYDALHRVDAISQFAATAQAVVQPKLIDYEYNLAGDRTTLTRYSDLAGTQLVGTTTYAGYDGVGRLSALTHTDGAGALIASYNMTYDRAHRLVSGSHANRFGNQTQAYTYDSAGQITSAVRTGTGAATETFSYDTSGNRTNASGVSYTNTNNNRIVSDGVYNYYYDDEGNLIRRIALVGGQPTGWTRDFAWDQHNRLTSVTDRYGGPTAPVSATYTYRYDSFDRRVRASRVINFPSFSSRDEYFFYDGQDVAFTTGTPLENARYLHGAAVDEVLAREWLGTTTTYWAYTDHLGSVRDVLSGNFVSEHMDYTIFGVRQPGSGSWHYGFTGREFDSGTGLNYHRNRWLDPGIGRWISEDPIGFQGRDLNLNRYVGNKTPNAIDPSGLKGPGHHIVPWSIFYKVVTKDVQKFLDSAEARICNQFYNSHGAQTINGVSHDKYTKLVRAELNKFLGKKQLKDLTVKDAKKFLAHLNSLPGTHNIQRFNKGVKAAANKALRVGMQKLALRRVQAAAARRGIAYNPVVGAMSGGLVTVAFAAYDAANTPYDENNNCLFGPRIDAAIEGMLPFGLRPEVGQLMRENEERRAREPAIALDVVSPDPPINFYQPDDGGPPYSEGEIGTGVITIGR